MKKVTIILFAVLSIIPSFSQTMEWHIKDNYADIQCLGNDLFKVKNSSGKWGVVNAYGEMTVEAQYDSITPVVENRALLLDVTGQYLKGIMNENGQIIKSFHNNERLANYPYFSEGMLAYGVVSRNYYLFGYLDINGNVRIEPKYYWAAPFFKGRAVVQYQSKNYGLINQSGGVALNDNRKFKFMSTPVDNQLLIAVGSNRGEKVLLVNLEADGKLREIEEIEHGTIVKNGSDYKSLSCQNGHRYFFDDAMRLTSSSTGREFNAQVQLGGLTATSSVFKKIRDQHGWKIQYNDKTLLYAPFSDVVFLDDEYAFVTSQRKTKGVLKLNADGYMGVQGGLEQTEFYHNVPVQNHLAVNIVGLRSASQIQIGVVGLKPNNQEDTYKVPVGYRGTYNQPISYFIPANRLDTEVNLPIKINLYIDGMLYKSEEMTLTGVHKKAFSISECHAPEYSDPNGNATVTFNVQSLKSSPSSSAKIMVRGASHQVKLFNGAEKVSFSIPVTVPFESVNTFSFTVTVEEEGCPAYTRTISRSIKHYVLQ